MRTHPLFVFLSGAAGRRQDNSAPAPTPVPVDKTDLLSLIDDVNTNVGDEGDYTPETWGPFAAALQSAQTVAADDDATQTQVDDAHDALDLAYNALATV